MFCHICGMLILFIRIAKNESGRVTTNVDSIHAQMAPSFTIFVQRRDSEGDDILTITPVGRKYFKMTFSDESDRSLKPRAALLNKDDVMDVVSSHLFLLSKDTKPFTSVQISPPHLSSIVLAVSSLAGSTTRDHVLRILDITLHNWPEEVKRPVTGAHARSGINNPEDEEEAPVAPPPTRSAPVDLSSETETESEEEEDLPPLEAPRARSPSTERMDTEDAVRPSLWPPAFTSAAAWPSSVTW
jgi:hypothetical protein